LKRFEVHAGWFLGIAAPLAETLRRRTDFSEPANYIDDYLGGALLICGAWAASRKGVRGRALLAGAWGVATGGMYYSFFGQLRTVGEPDISGLPGWAVVAGKGAIFVLSIVCLALSVRSCRDVRTAP